MKRLVAAFAANPVAANLLMVFVLAAGLLSVPRLRQETYPNVAFDFISIAVAYPGAAPDEVERAVCVRIEEAIHGIRDVHRILSRAEEGYGAVWAQLAVGADARRVLEDVRARVDALDTLPAEAERPMIQELIDDSILLSVMVHGEVDERRLRSAGEKLRDTISALPEVNRAELVGVRPAEIAVEVSEVDLRRHGLSFDDVTRSIRASSLDLPGGSLKTAAGEILVRTGERAQRRSEFERLVLLTRRDGTRLLLGDVARVRDGFAESDEKVRFDGLPAAVVRLRTSERGNVLDISRAVRAAALRVELPEGVRLAIWGDQSRQFEGRRDLLLRSGAQGLVLILLILALFLRLRLALWVAAGIPIAFTGALIFLAVLDVSINMMSLFAFIVALGLVVDDAIVIGENVARHRRRGGDPLAAAIAGTTEVAMPVTVAVLTTIFFALPAVSMPTVVGKIARSLGVVVIACLVFSLVEALLILPAHLARGRATGAPDQGDSGKDPGRWARLRRGVDDATERLVGRGYRPLLERALRWPQLTLALCAAALMLSAGALSGGWLRYAFFPNVEDDWVSAHLVLPAGTPPEVVEAHAARIEDEALALAAALSGGDRERRVVEHVLVAIGDPPDRHDDFNSGGEGSNVATVRMGLVPGELREVTSLEISERWRSAVGPVPGALELSFSGTDLGAGRAIDVSLSGTDRDELARSGAALASVLAGVPGVRDISDTWSGGKRQLDLRIRPEAEALGLTQAELARQVRQGFHGEEVQRIQRGRDDVAVVVRYPAAERRSLRALSDVRIRLPDGSQLPFATVATGEIGRGPAALERRDLRPSVSVRADVDDRHASASGIIADLVSDTFPRLAASHPGVAFDLDGESREEAELSSRLARDWLLATLAAYALLAVALRSYLQPVVILAAVPFGWVGGLAGHALLGVQVSSFSMIGALALAGVVINDALVLIDRANRNRAQGMALRPALLEAGATRFRAIALTSLTTFFGLLPLLFERSAQAAWLEPMAVMLGFGVMFATVVTLVLVPAAMVALEDAQEGARALGRRLWAAAGLSRPEGACPAPAGPAPRRSP